MLGRMTQVSLRVWLRRSENTAREGGPGVTEHRLDSASHARDYFFRSSKNAKLSLFFRYMLHDGTTTLFRRYILSLVSHSLVSVSLQHCLR